ncbi:MAG: UbiX family flavin prenyltransferase [Gammaproteobacteria bacterium]|nr:UbiX family flavin prenyltransferase [Gammaproteobacteria bacterium]
MTESGYIGLGMTGASGAQYGLRLLEVLVAAGQRVHVVMSEPARMVINTETTLRLPSRANDCQAVLRKTYGKGPGTLEVFGKDDWFAPMASGSNPPQAMVVCPCTTGTLGALAAGLSRSLLERAADVALKENRPLIVVPRETPFSAIHLENMLTLNRAGAVILPANPAFYHRPETVEDIVDFVVARILDQLGITQTLTPRWGAER